MGSTAGHPTPAGPVGPGAAPRAMLRSLRPTRFANRGYRTKLPTDHPGPGIRLQNGRSQHDHIPRMDADRADAYGQRSSKIHCGGVDGNHRPQQEPGRKRRTSGH